MPSDDITDSWDLSLSHYLDGELSADEEATLLLELDRSPALQTRFAHMKTVHEAIKNVAAQASQVEDATASMPSLWNAIESQLQSDAANSSDEALMDHALESVSVYYDGELNAEEREQFEAQLHSQTALNHLLADFGTISQSLSRSVERCSIDVSDTVMTQFAAQAELSDLILPAGLTIEQIEMLSAHSDDELKPQESIVVNRLLESTPEAKASLQQFNHLHDTLQQARSRWETEAPSTSWATIQSQLAQDPVFLSDARQKRNQRNAQFQKAMWLGAPMAAAAALLLLSWPALQVNDLMGNSISLISDTAPANQQIASLPRFKNGNLSRLSSSGENVPVLPVLPVLRTNGHNSDGKAQTILVPTRPMLDPTVHQLATRRLKGRTDASNFGNKNGKKAPSSEEYLFNALDEQGSGAELSNLLND